MRKNVRLFFFFVFSYLVTDGAIAESTLTCDGSGSDSAMGVGEESPQVARRSTFSSSPTSPLITTHLTGYLYTAFASKGDYEFVLNYAKELGVVLWENATKRCFFGSSEGHTNIKAFIERRPSTS